MPGLTGAASLSETLAGAIKTKGVVPYGLSIAVPFQNVRQRATGDGVTDDAPAIRTAAAAAAAANRPLFFPPGTYLLNSVDANNNFVTLTEGLEIFGHNATIKIGTSVTSWNHVFGPAQVQVSPNTDLSGLNVHDLIFDGNSTLNPINASNPTARRYIVGAYAGTDIRAHDNQIVNWDARNLFLFDGRIDGINNIWVYGNRGTNLGGAYWHDTSWVFASGVNVSVFDNHMTGYVPNATTPSSAWTAYEVHGVSVHCHDNSATNVFSMFNVVSLYTGQPGGDSKGYHYHDNVGINVGCGFTIWPQVVGSPITDLHIHHNTFDINIAQWPTAAGANNYPGTPGSAGHYGVGLIVGNSYVERCRIEDNDFIWRTAASPSTNDHGVWWVHPTSQASSGPVDSHVSICRNRFVGTPHGGIYVQWYFGLSNWDVCDNTFHNIGKAAAGANSQAGMTVLDTNSLTVASHTAIEDFRFCRNKFVDDQATHTLLRLLKLAGGTSKTVSLGFTSGSSTVTYSGSTMDATDVRSNIESATAVLAAADRIISSAPAAGSFTISGNATATVTENATITGGCGNTANVEMLDNQVRIEDGAAIQFFEGQASGSPQHPAFTGQSATIRARGTGTPESNQQGGVGSQWARTDGGAATSFYVKESGTGTTGWVGK